MHRFIKRVHDGEHAERGFFMVWFALLFVTLLGFAGIALEFNRWESLGVRVQKAADAAALAGAVFLPDNLTQAQNTAKSTSSKNGFTHGVNGVTITATKGRLPNQLKVSISLPTKNPFGAIVGYGNSTIVRNATAEYQLPQNLGSPQNTYGNNPETPPAGGQPQFWGNVFGPSSFKAKGDAYQAKICDGTPADNCPNGGANADYDSKGYFYGIDVPTGTSGALNVQVFDPAFVHVGDNCTDGDAVNSLNKAAALTAASIPGYSGSVTPATRYASGGASPFCTGDMSYSGDNGNNLNPWTVWTVRAPDSSTWDPTNNPIVCQAEFPGIFPERINDLPTGAVNSDRLSDLLKSSADYPGVSPAMRFNAFFRQWVTLCSVPTPVSGTYFLQVQTLTKIDGTPAPMAGGANRYSVQVGIGTNYTSSNGLRLYGNARMGVYANASGADTRFFLTRILPGEAGKFLILQFFDTGDASAAGDIQVLPPPDSNVSGGTFTGCKYTAPPGNSTGPPWGTLVNTATACKVTGVSSGSFNGQWVTYEIPIPANYDCDDTIATGCWTRLRFSYPTGTSVQDTTSWAAYVLGEPVRLIQ